MKTINGQKIPVQVWWKLFFEKTAEHQNYSMVRGLFNKWAVARVSWKHQGCKNCQNYIHNKINLKKVFSFKNNLYLLRLFSKYAISIKHTNVKCYQKSHPPVLLEEQMYPSECCSKNWFSFACNLTLLKLFFKNHFESLKPKILESWILQELTGFLSYIQTVMVNMAAITAKGTTRFCQV